MLMSRYPATATAKTFVTLVAWLYVLSRDSVGGSRTRKLRVRRKLIAGAQHHFVKRYIAGTDKIDYSPLLLKVGLLLRKQAGR